MSNSELREFTKIAKLVITDEQLRFIISLCHVVEHTRSGCRTVQAGEAGRTQKPTPALHSPASNGEELFQDSVGESGM
jgi:hypothetical protein